MRIFKNKAFRKWAEKAHLSDCTLITAVSEIERGLVDADLGGHVFKKRIPVGGQGKRSGARTLLAYQVNDKAFFVYGFAKNERSNINTEELKALKAYALTLLAYSNEALAKAVSAGALI